MRKWLFLIVTVVFSACSNRPDGVMSQREMKTLLTDLHVLESMLMRDVKLAGDDRKQAYYYNSLFQKYSITKADFDSSLVYYTKRPKQFERIYAGVLLNLKEMEKDARNGRFERLLPDSIRLKPEFYYLTALDSAYRFTSDSTRTRLAFAVVDPDLLTKDIYHLRFRLRREPADSSEGAYAALRIHYADGKVDSIWHKTVNDSVLRRYHFRFRAARNFPIDSLSGVLLGVKKEKGKFGAILDSISLQREYIPYLQDTLRSKLDTVPSKMQKADLAVPDSIPSKR